MLVQVQREQQRREQRQDHRADDQRQPDLHRALQKALLRGPLTFLGLDLDPDHATRNPDSSTNSSAASKMAKFRQREVAQHADGHVVQHDADQRITAQHVERRDALHLGSFAKVSIRARLSTSASFSGAVRKLSASAWVVAQAILAPAATVSSRFEGGRPASRAAAP